MKAWRVAPVLVVLALVTGCSSEGGSSTPASSFDTNPPSYSPSPGESVCDAQCLGTFSPPAPETSAPSNDMAAAVSFVESNRLAIESMINAGVVFKKALRTGYDSSDCAELGSSTASFDEAVPKVGEPGNADPLVQSLADVSGAYYTAGLTCLSKKDLRGYVAKADAAIARAESLAQQYGTSL